MEDAETAAMRMTMLPALSGIELLARLWFASQARVNSFDRVDLDRNPIENLNAGNFQLLCMQI